MIDIQFSEIARHFFKVRKHQLELSPPSLTVCTMIITYNDRSFYQLKHVFRSSKLCPRQISQNPHDVKEPTHCPKREGDVFPSVVIYLYF